MKAVVTNVGAYNGVPAFEYEIREDDDTMLAVDFVIIHPHAGETWEDLAGFMERSFLPKRAAKWALSNADQRAGRREARTGGRRLNKKSAPPALGGQIGMPSVTVTASEAHAMRMSEQPAPVLDDRGRPTGEMRAVQWEHFRL